MPFKTKAEKQAYDRARNAANPEANRAKTTQWLHENRERDSARRRQFERDHPEWKALAGAKQRCRNPRDRRYSDYGGRGIEYRMPEKAREAEAVLLTAIGPRPEGHSLDRIDNDGHYEIGNLRWADAATQRRNQRR